MFYDFRRPLMMVLIFCLFFAPLLGQQSNNQTTTGTSTPKININTATLEELQTLPRIGPAIAQRIIDYRKEHGPFKKIEEIMKVRGIGERVFEQIKDRITVGSETTNKE